MHLIIFLKQNKNSQPERKQTTEFPERIPDGF
ncbi:hypothetical protein RIR_e30597_A0A2N1NWY3_9GLOM [Rhizophagus irregularis DAOM 181602=DAOM 197198]|nr:hypothetical protein RIR_e30597_A0A2N1NWY3_9GLOM [Rhizophagus irregularis DAOM 181602=DAOM 197198]